MELAALKVQTDSLVQLLYGSLELAELPNGPQIAVTVDALCAQLLQVIEQLQTDVEALRHARS